jgi:undecaprenyl phosphate-alpha-L-ara4N flippase subunit ArnE
MFWKLSTDGGILLLFSGVFLYGIGAISMIIAFKYDKLSVLQPMLSLNYILTIILVRLILNEEFSILKLIGILVISLGVIIIAGSNE